MCVHTWNAPQQLAAPNFNKESKMAKILGIFSIPYLDLH